MSPRYRVMTILAVLTLTLVCLASACDSKVIKPTVVPPGFITADLQEQVLPNLASNPKFHVYERSDDSFLIAFSCTLTAPDGLKSEVYGIKVQSLNSADDPESGWGMTGLDMKKVFDGVTPRGKKAIDGGGYRYSLAACGTAMDRRTAMIVAVTKSGQIRTTIPRNGFWALEVKDVSEDDAWTSIKAVDAQGSTLFQYPLTD